MFLYQLTIRNFVRVSDNLNEYVILFVLFSPGDDCRNIIFRDPIQNMAMKDRVIWSAEVPNEGSCRVMCYMEPDCVSINVGPVEGGNQKCELNNATEENHVPFLLMNKPGFIYLTIEVKFYIFTNLREVRHMIYFHFRLK